MDPNAALILLIVGLMGLYWELHAPGLILPGLIGTVLFCAAGYELFRYSASPGAITLVVLAIVLLGIELKYYTHMISGFLGAVLLGYGAVLLVAGPERISPALAVALATATGAIVLLLGWLGMKARKEPLLSGLTNMKGTEGVTQGELNPEGLIFIQGEYWKAHSDIPIPAGRRVTVDRVNGLVLYVREA